MIKSKLVKCTLNYFISDILVFEEREIYQVFYETDDRISIVDNKGDNHIFSTSSSPNDINPLFYGDYFDKIIETA